jgi:hypothetical protein
MLHLNALLNAAAILAVAQALVKALEIALDSRQKLAFQQAIDTLALKLIDVDPIRHYERLREHKVQLKWLAAVILCIWTSALFYSLQDFGFSVRGWWSDFPLAWFLAIPILFYPPFRVVLWWLGRSRNVYVVLMRTTVLGLILLAGGGVMEKYDGSPLISHAFVLILGLCFYTAAVIGVLYVAQAVVWLFRHIMWRIATDARGAWSAALFVLAVLLALAATLVSKS